MDVVYFIFQLLGHYQGHALAVVLFHADVFARFGDFRRGLYFEQTSFFEQSKYPI